MTSCVCDVFPIVMRRHMSLLFIATSSLIMGCCITSVSLVCMFILKVDGRPIKTNSNVTSPAAIVDLTQNISDFQTENHTFLQVVETVYKQADKGQLQNHHGDSLTRQNFTNTLLPTIENLTLSANENAKHTTNNTIAITANENLTEAMIFLQEWNEKITSSSNDEAMRLLQEWNENMTSSSDDEVTRLLQEWNENITSSSDDEVTRVLQEWNENMTSSSDDEVTRLLQQWNEKITSSSNDEVTRLLQQWNENTTSSSDVITSFKTLVDILKQANERNRRQAMFDMGDLANEDWDLNYTTHNPLYVNDSYPMHDFEVISEEDVLRAKHLYMKKVLTYVGITMGSVLVFTVIGFFFITDPKSCVLAFATGSPCCLVLCPCIVQGLSQFLNPGQVVRDQMNTYLPGMLIDRDGNIELYEITPAEMEAIQVMINDVIDFVS